ncbi:MULTISPECIES: serine/threonine protein kinase [unclassified Streptosporangium]|uniref:serine/threonine protein kinase n=1 Tax=unclassified Streptosporangium TaxID=2632669 RepID=UPI002E27B733|nr:MULTISPECIES: serine/threonine-protein kinase [unclassified Streptosporangium]
MTRVLPPAPGDPDRIGPHRVTGRIGRGGQGTVYLAESPAGARVAVKVLGKGGGEQTLARFHREIELARRVEAFCTAQVLEHGETGGMPYIVSEYVDGPSLAQVIDERGPLRGAELRRLAVGTVTALAAIHRAGVVHRDFKPANVLLARDGPRVIDFGISRALDATVTASDHLVGTPPYMAPEQFDGRETGPSADLFAWASTVVCAATGEPPFGTGPVPAVIHRILNAEPVLGSLDDELRELVGECLAKDPRARPAAMPALLRLLGHPAERPSYGTGHEVLGEGRKQAAPPPARRRASRPVIAALAALALAAASGVAVLAVRAAGTEEPVKVVTGGTDGTPSVPAARPAIGTMPTTSTTDLRIPGTKVTLRENPADPERVTSYRDSRGRASGDPVYLRRGDTAEFRFLGTFMTAVAAPGGARVAANPDNKFELGEFDLIRLVDPAGGPETQIRTVDTPLTTFNPHWDRNGTRILLTIYEGLGKEQRSRGFVIVDVASRTARVFRVPDDDHRSDYVWGADSASVLHSGPDGSVRFYRPDGTPLRTVPKVGALVLDDVRTTSLGTVFTTRCQEMPRDVCLWDAATATRRAVVPIKKGMIFNGWLGDRHFLGTVTEGKTTKVVMLDLRGEVVRVLADGPAAELKEISLYYTLR